MKTVSIIGAGLGGISAAIRLVALGFEVKVFEKNAYAGGKLCEMQLGKYRFDKGPSLLTMPELIDELTMISGIKESFKYKKLENLTNYFFEDGIRLEASANIDKFAETASTVLGESKVSVKKHLKRAEYFYDITSEIFLKNSIHRLKYLLKKHILKGLLHSWRLQLWHTMNSANQMQFRNPKTIQIFNRYATYNGSNPYKAPALLNIIPHLEFGLGAYLPDEGMYAITKHLVKCAQNLGVEFVYNSHVDSISIENNQTTGIMANNQFHSADIVVSDVDMHLLYKKLLPQSYTPHKLLSQEKSSSAYIFYWGISKVFDELDVHNILFSEDYQAEFKDLFTASVPFHDPTIYINITSKLCKDDAPEGCENWFVMVNVPHNATQQKIIYGNELRKNVVSKINKILKTDIEQYIEVEEVLDPYGIEIATSSFGGSLYGNSSNNMFSAFMRHANYSSKIKGLYLAGGSVHPGGGIPLSLLSGSIVSKLVMDDYHLYK